MEKLIAENSFPVTAYRLVHRTGVGIQPVVLLLLRLSWGFQLVESGFGHLTHIQATVDQFIKWGVPMPQVNVYISGVTELAGGILLGIGLGSRLVSIPLVFNFIVAIVVASRVAIADAFKNKGFQGGWDQIVNDTAFPFLMLALIILAFGAGSLSIDYLLGRKMFCKHDDGRGGFEVGSA